MAAINRYGFSRETLDTIVQLEKERFRNFFGDADVYNTEAVVSQMASLSAERRNELYKLFEEALATVTYSGAEGPHLDNLLSAFTKRRRASFGYIDAQVEIDDTVSNTYVIPEDTLISSSGGNRYFTNRGVTAREAVNGFIIRQSQVDDGAHSYVLTVGTDTYTLNVSVADHTDNTQIQSFFQTIVNFIINNTDNTSSNVYIDTTQNDIRLLAGYNSSEDLQGLESVIGFYDTADTFEMAVQTRAANEKRGYYPIQPGDATSLNPSFSGFKSVTNITSGFAGRDTETDAEYRARHERTINTPSSVTIDGIASYLLDSGVTDVKIYENTTSSNTTEADAFTFNTVVLGTPSVDKTIQRLIYEAMPVNTLTSGTNPETIEGLDGVERTIYYTPASRQDINVKIEYSTSSGTPLSENEKRLVNDAVVNTVTEHGIGGILRNFLLVVSVLNSLAVDRFTDVNVYTKDIADPPGSYSTNNYNVSYNEYVSTAESYIEYSQI